MEKPLSLPPALKNQPLYCFARFSLSSNLVGSTRILM